MHSAWRQLHINSLIFIKTTFCTFSSVLAKFIKSNKTITWLKNRPQACKLALRTQFHVNSAYAERHHANIYTFCTVKLNQMQNHNILLKRYNSPVKIPNCLQIPEHSQSAEAIKFYIWKGKFCLARQYNIKLRHYFCTLRHDFQQFKAQSLQAQKLRFINFQNTLRFHSAYITNTF